MRGIIDGLATPVPLSDTLPSMLREDPFARELCASLDEVLAPILLTLDSFAAYLDVGTTPEDMLPWLAQWVGLTVEKAQDGDAQREALRTACDVYALRGTRSGIERAISSALGVEVHVSESGAPILDTADRGPGMPETVSNQLFRPFFTTSEHGTGLGLWRQCRSAP